MAENTDENLNKNEIATDNLRAFQQVMPNLSLSLLVDTLLIAQGMFVTLEHKKQHCLTRHNTSERQRYSLDQSSAPIFTPNDEALYSAALTYIAKCKQEIKRREQLYEQ